MSFHASPPAPRNSAPSHIPAPHRTVSLTDVAELDRVPPSLDLLARVASAAARVARGGPAERVDLSDLDPANRRVVAEILGDGDMAIDLAGTPALRIRDCTFAGIWFLAGADVDAIEVAGAPENLRRQAFRPTRHRGTMRSWRR